MHSSERKGLCLMKWVMTYRNTSKFAIFLEYGNLHMYIFFVLFFISCYVHTLFFSSSMSTLLRYKISSFCPLIMSKQKIKFCLDPRWPEFTLHHTTKPEIFYFVFFISDTKIFICQSPLFGQRTLKLIEHCIRCFRCFHLSN